MADILVVDDDRALSKMLVEHLKRKGYTADFALDISKGLHKASHHDYDVVFLDVQFPEGNGLESLQQFACCNSHPEIIIMTGSGDPDGAQKAMEYGAWSYLEKPNVLRHLLLPLTRALQYREEKNRITSHPVVFKRDNIIGKSLSLNQCLDKLAKAAVTDMAVLITGATGTGKEIFAKALHDNSTRSSGNFVVVDCASLPESLIESTLFGHIRGAFTGADSKTEGLIQLANGGTLFLDEIGELPLSMQTNFLRVLQERSYRPIGSLKEIKSDFRVVSATNKDLKQLVVEKTFRSDLLFRLRATDIHLPPLKDRLEDIPELTRSILKRLSDNAKVPQKIITNEFLESLQLYDWPGNIRELEQALAEVFSKAHDHPTLFEYHLPAHIRIKQAREAITKTQPANNFSVNQTVGPPPPWKIFKNQMEQQYINALMKYVSGNINNACEISGISRARVYQLINKHGSQADQEK